MMLALPDYTLVDRIHKGPKTVLFRGYRRADRLPVVVKFLKDPYPGAREIAELRHEFAILRDIALPGVVKALALERCSNGLALVLEHLSGQPLAAAAGGRRLGLEAALRVGAGVAQILEGVHQRHVIHKDIQPHNVLWDEETGQVHLVGFGIATRLAQETQKATSPEALEGTLAYMSPEQTGRMNRVIDHRTDFYSLGVTLYQLLTGVLPFDAADPMELVHCHIARAPAPPHALAPDVPEMVSRVVMKLLAKTAEDRYQSARGLRADLEACLADLRATGAIAPFPLARHDRPDTLRIPQKLYGRAAEVDALVAAFDRVRGGSAELLLVSGYSGIGKSALVHEIHKPIARRGGYFVGGKFDQFHRAVPYASVAQAFRDLVRQILSERPERLARWKEALHAALGSAGQLLVDLIPELQLVVGPQPHVPPLGPTEAQNRFHQLFTGFVRVFARPEHPLVLFLDDLQWADPASLRLLQVLLGDPDRAHLLVIGAYRDNEVDASHPLFRAVADLGEANVATSEITLRPLAFADVVELLADTLGRERRAVDELARVVFDRTQSNPFFVRQFLAMLHGRALVRFDADAGAWTWDIEGVRTCPATDNVVDLMIGKIRRLDPELQRVLKLAACIGHQFDLRTLSVICERTPRRTAEVLWGALQAGLVLPVDVGYRLVHRAAGDEAAPEDGAAGARIPYRFLHDRVQQAAYSLISDDHKKEAHLRVGRLILAGTQGGALDEVLFDVVNHLNIGASLLASDGEKQRLAELNLAAGRKAKAATAYRAAADHFRAGMDVLPASAWDDGYEVAFALHKEGAEAEYLSGHFELAEALYPVALANARTAIDEAAVCFVQGTQYQLQGRLGEAIRCYRESLRLLGWAPPDGEAELVEALDAEMQAVGVHLAGREIEDLVHAPRMAVPEIERSLEVLQGLFYAAYVNSEQTLASLSLAKMTTLSLQYGNSEISPFGYVGYGLLAGGLLGDYATGHRFGRMAIALCEHFDNIAVACQTNFLFAADVNAWSRHIKTSDVYYDHAYELGLESGDWVTMGYMIIQSGADRLIRGRPLAEHHATCQAHLAFLRRVQSHDIADLLMAGVVQPIRNLQGLTNDRRTFDGPDFSEDAFLSKYAGLPYHLCWFYYAKIRSAYWFGDRAAALALADELDLIEKFVPSHAKVPETFFYVALIRLDACDGAAEKERAEHLAAAEKLLERLRFWARCCPENVLHKVLLVEAEKARVEGRRADAMDLYDRAMESARENDYINTQALGNERYARFWLDQGRTEIAQLYLRKAIELWDQWGARAKAEQLAEEHADLVAYEPRSKDLAAEAAQGAAATAVDVATVVSAYQAISSEIVLDRLLDRLMRIVVGNAGASRGFLLLQRGGALVVEAMISVDPDRVQVGLRTPVEERSDLAATLVHYVARTGETVVVEDAADDARFAADPYVAAQRPRSLLCLALVHQGRPRGILYLENSLAAGVFSANRIELLRLLSSQAAIAVENALLYAGIQDVSGALKDAKEQLEHDVAERTDELRVANERLTHELAERERAEAARAALHEEIIRMQRELLTELSTPLIPITAEVMVLPLVGGIDAQRAQQVLETVLDGAQRAGAQVVIIDVTGLRHVDERVAHALVKTASALRLLGTQAVLTGVRPDVAQKLIEINADLRGIVVQGTLQSGIAYAVARTGSGATRAPAPAPARRPAPA